MVDMINHRYSIWLALKKNSILKVAAGGWIKGKWNI